MSAGILQVHQAWLLRWCKVVTSSECSHVTITEDLGVVRCLRSHQLRAQDDRYNRLQTVPNVSEIMLVAAPACQSHFQTGLPAMEV